MKTPSPWIKDKVNSNSNPYSVYEVPAVKEWADNTTAIEQQIIAYSPVIMEYLAEYVAYGSSKKLKDKARKLIREITFQDEIK